MVKVRLHGTIEELERLKAVLKDTPELTILNCSEPYKDRGESMYYRYYIDVEVKDSK